MSRVIKEGIVRMGAMSLLLAACCLTGCVTSRQIVEPKLKTATNPDKGTAVRIETVNDARQFQVGSSQPSTPSLKDNEVGDANVRNHAIARKRNPYGQALGDVMLPDTQTVTGIVAMAVTRSFQNAGYRVVGPADAAYAQAVPVKARIDKLWAWASPGYPQMTVKSNYEIHVSAPIASLQPEAVLGGHYENGSLMVTGGDYSDAIVKALDDFSSHLEEKLKAR